MNYHKYIAINPNIRFGRPCLIGTRISVYDVLGWLAAGMNIPEILEDFPQLNQSQILACLAYASERERRVKVVI